MTALRKVYLEITNVCNLACDFCPGTRRTKSFLSAEQFRVLAGRIRPHTQYLYLHLMGEPLLHPQLDELLSIAEELDFKVMLTTNGTLLPRRQELLCTSPALRKTSISLHSFEGNKPAGTLESYLNGCITYAKAAAQAGKLCAFRLWNLDGETTQGANQENDHILQLLHAAFPGEWKTDWKGATLAPHIYLEWGEKFEWPDLTASEHEGKAFCYGLRDHVGVLCDGTVVPCCLDHEGDIPLGDLFEQPLDEILASSRAQAIYNGFSNGSACEELCRKCGYSRRFTK